MRLFHDPPEHELDREPHRLADASFVGAEHISAVNDAQALGDGGEMERPVNGGVAAADDDDIFALILVQPAHNILNAGAFQFVDAGAGEARRPQRADARGDDNRFGEVPARVGFNDVQIFVRVVFQRLGTLL